MNIARWFLAVGEHPKTKLSDIRVAAYLARQSDESGSFSAPDLVEPLFIVEALMLSNASVYRAFGTLEALGFIEWQKTAMLERFGGSTSRVSLNLQHIQG